MKADHPDFEPIADNMLGAFEGDCRDSLSKDRRSNMPGESRVLMKYFGQTIRRLRIAEKQRKDLLAALTQIWKLACTEGDIDSETDWEAVRGAIAKAGGVDE